MAFNNKQMYADFTAYTVLHNEDTGKDDRLTLASERVVFGDGILSNERFDVSNGAAPAYAPHLYMSGTGDSDTVRITVMHEFTAQVTYADGTSETMRRGHHIGAGLYLNEYARNCAAGAVIMRTVSVVGARGEVHVLETTRAVYAGASVRPVYRASARTVGLSVTRAGAYKPRKLSAQDVARRYVRGLETALLHIAQDHGTDGTHFDVTWHIENTAQETQDVVHDAPARRKSLSGAQRRKLRKLRKQAQTN